MQNHYMEPITLELVADKVGFNSSYFSSFFKKETGAGFADYLIQLRMEKAKELLKDTKDTVKEVCVYVSQVYRVKAGRIQKIIRLGVQHGRRLEISDKQSKIFWITFNDSVWNVLAEAAV